MYHPLLLFLPWSFFIITMAAVQTNISDFQNCLPSDCNGLKISYPFWKIDNQTSSQYCGYEGCGINCTILNNGQNRPTPMMHFGGDSYYVRSLTNTSITLVDYDVSSVFPVQKECPRVKHGIELERLPLNYSSNNLNLSFHFNCTGDVPSFATVIPCLNNDSKWSCINVINPENENHNWGELACEDEVVTSVLDAVLSNERLGTEFPGALRTGFELHWQITTDDCDKCEDSGGLCGYSNSTEFMCFCSDGTSTRNDCSAYLILVNVIVTASLILVNVIITASLILTSFTIVKIITRKRHSSVDCATNGSSLSSFAVFHPEILEQNNYSIDLCEKSVHVPVHVDSLDVLLYEYYTDVLRKGFVLEWQCSNCEKHGIHLFSYSFVILIGVFEIKNASSNVSGKKMNLGRKVLIAVISVIFGVCLMVVVFYFYRRRRNKERYYASSYMSNSSYGSSVTDPEKSEAYHGVQIFKYRELEKATNHFDSANELGDGGFGTVYQGKLKDGRVVAVKRLYENNFKRVEQFMNEIGILAHLRHQNLVSLYGCTTHHSRELLLVHRHEINLSNMALNKIQNNELHELVDPNLGFETDYEVRKMISAVAQLAFQCLQNERGLRPSMDEVLEGLIGIQNGRYNNVKQDVFDGTSDDAVLLKDDSQTMSPDSVAIAWSTSTISSSSSG
ncbi:protein kinase-like domain-containing protein [Artemisia annua]|uniref:non-specific serine/threonine protein kinase n=1 Tax=Artemisia annua TaxID=35608 RepID=A0A2U1PA50_ARTAN|nr:protein kinase-like domain-containing protein [Artemisia annua]